MAYALLGNAKKASTDNNTATTAAVDTTGANLIVVGVASDLVSPTLSDSKGNTWIGLTEKASGNNKARLYYCYAPTVGSGHTFTATASASAPNICVQWWSGALVSPFDQQNGATSAPFAASLATGSVTPGQANELIVAFATMTNDPTPTIDSGFTVSDTSIHLGGTALGAAMAYLVETTATAKNPTWTSGGAADYMAVAIATFKSGTPAAALAATSAFGVSATAALTIRPALAAATSLAVGSSSATLRPGAMPLSAAAAFGVAAAAALTAPAGFRATSSFAFSTSALFAAVRFTATTGLRFSTVATLSTGVELEHASRVSILLAGVENRIRKSSITISDIANDNPNTCTLTIDGLETPQVGQSLRVSLNLDAPRLLFNGSLQDVELTYEELADQLIYPTTAIDDTPRANRRRPFAVRTNASATTVVQDLIAAFAPGFTATHVQPDLPPVSIILDGSEGMNGALRQIVDLIGGWFFWQDGELWLFNDPAFLGVDLPEALDAFNTTLLKTPPIKARVDDSQLRTRVFGKGHGEALLVDIAAGESIMPVANAAAWFGTVGAGGHAIALSQILAYTAVQPGGGGSLVGPGAQPSTAPVVTRVTTGTGLGTGFYGYAVVDVTAAGKTLASPVGTVQTGAVTGSPIPNPTTAPVGTPIVGVGMNIGDRLYAFSLVNAAGETVPGPTVSVYTPMMAVPGTPTYVSSHFGQLGNGVFPANQWGWAVTFVGPYGESSYGGRVTWGNFGGTPGTVFLGPSFTGIPIGPAGTTARNIYRTKVQPDNAQAMSAVAFLEGTIPDNTTTTWDGGNIGDSSLGGTTFGLGATSGQNALTAVAVGPAGTTARKVYRTERGLTQLRLVATISDNTTTTYTDSMPDGSLGANAPTSNTTAITTTAFQTSVSGIALGASSTTSRELYRTAVQTTLAAALTAQLKFLTTIAGNVSTGPYADSTADGSLGANAPISDTSGISFTGGQVNAGAIAIQTASSAPFPSSGWAITSDGQFIRYTGITGQTLTGVPVTGPGALLTTILFGSPIIPAPALTGVTGVVVPILKGTTVNIWIQRDDLTAQAELTARDGSDGIVEAAPISDERRGEASLIALCDATLARYSRPLVEVTFDSRDVKIKSSLPMVIDLVDPPIHQTLTIQEVTITELGIADGLAPRYSVMASSVRNSLDGLIRKLLAAAA